MALGAGGEGYVLVNFVRAILTSIDYKQELNILRSGVKSFISLLLWASICKQISVKSHQITDPNCFKTNTNLMKLEGEIDT